MRGKMTGTVGELGKAFAFEGNFVINCLVTSYKVSYNTPEAGVILYNVNRMSTLEPCPQAVYSPKRQKKDSALYAGIAMSGAALAVGCYGGGGFNYALTR